MTPTPSFSNTHVGRPHTAISRRWRAQTFAQIVGQSAVVETLRNAVRLGRVGHGYLFVGPRGTGKTSMARILAKAVNCTNLNDGEPCDACASCVAIREGNALDVAEFDAASNNTVSDMRDLLPRVHTAPADLQRKVFIVDEVQRIKEGWDVLLKTLEEPPPHVLFVFCTTDPTQIRPAVLSRLQRFTFRPLTVDEITGKLRRILADDGRAAEPDAVRLVAELAAGGMRDAESMLDQLLSSAADPLTADAVRRQLGLAAGAEIDAFLTALLDRDPLAGIRLLDRLEADGRDLRLVTDQAVERLRRVLIAKLGMEPVPEPFAVRAIPELTAAARALAAIDPARAGGGGQRLQLELLLLSSTVPAGAPASGVAVSATAWARPTGGGTSSAADQDGLTARRDGPAVQPRMPPGGPRSPSVASPPSGRPSSPTERSRGEPTIPPAAPAGPIGRSTRSRSSPHGEPTAAVGTPPEASGEVPPHDVLARVRAGWPMIVAHLSRTPLIKPLAEACRPVRLEGRVVVLGFPEDKAFLREKAEQRHGAFEEAIAAVVGAELGIRCVATNLEALPPLPHEAIGRENLDVARRVFAGDLADAADVD